MKCDMFSPSAIIWVTCGNVKCDTVLCDTGVAEPSKANLCKARKILWTNTKVLQFLHEALLLKRDSVSR